MLKLINELKAKKGRGEQGFTLIELLIVVAIIGILAAIAIPQFASYRIKSYNANAKADLRNIQTGEEAYYTDNNLYEAAGPTTGPAATFGSPVLPGVKISKDVRAQVLQNGTAAWASDYKVASQHYAGNICYVVSSGSSILDDASKVPGSWVTPTNTAVPTSGTTGTC
jgi:prepilin-type N-terminal cleavage/methylation domain-containing protein